jgi:predicted nucleotidyltransferase
LRLWRRFLRQWSPRDVQHDIATLKEVVRRIVKVAEPDQVILFGSAARGQLRPNSDFDLLIVKSGVSDTYELTRHLHAHLFDIRMPVDLIVATPEEIQASRYKMLGQIYTQGRRVYSSSQAQRIQPQW